VNEIPGQIQAVTAADVQRAARTYFKAANRTVVDRRPAAPPAAQKETR
jgi:predicted Zn-dependent peptidase